MNENSFRSRIKRIWNVFTRNDHADPYRDYGPVYTYRPDRVRLTRGNERSIVTAIYNRIAIDVSGIDIKHVRMDDNNCIEQIIDSPLNNCLTLEANIDQTSRAFMQDAVMSMFDEGSVAIVPVETDVNPDDTASYDILTMRTGKIVEWRPKKVKVNLYNENTGKREDVLVPKQTTAIVENPLYSVMNEPNSTMQRLIRKLNLLDAIDEQSGSGKLDLIIQLPYIVKTEARKKQAEERRKEIESQLTGSKYGIAYVDGTEHITQLNRAVENNLMGQIEYLTNMLYSQLGITETILNGTADEATMLNYTNSTIEPIISAFVNEMKRKFLSKTARTQKQSIAFISNPFKLVPISNIAEIGDKLTRNEILTSNEMRKLIGFMPSKDPNANILRNKNLNQAKDSSQEKHETSVPEDTEIDENSRIKNVINDNKNMIAKN